MSGEFVSLRRRSRTDDMHRMLGDGVAGRAARQLPVHVEGDDHAGRECDRTKIDELRRQAKTEYFDIMLLHWQHSGTWPVDTVAVAGRH